MAKLYGTIRGDKGKATRTSQVSLAATAQSWEGSVMVHMYYVDEDLVCEITSGGQSTAWPNNNVHYRGPLKDLISTGAAFIPVEKSPSDNNN